MVYWILVTRVRITPRWTRLAESASCLSPFQNRKCTYGSEKCKRETCMLTNLGTANCSRAHADRGCMIRNKISYKSSYNFFKIFVLLSPYVRVNMPRRFSNLSLLRRCMLSDAPLVFAKASECTLLLDLPPLYRLYVFVRCCNYPAGIRVLLEYNKVNSSK
jgi:hypothetical protein